MVLDTGLFPDRETVDAALQQLGNTHTVTRHDVSKMTPDDAAWDELVNAILKADRIITL